MQLWSPLQCVCLLISLNPILQDASLLGGEGRGGMKCPPFPVISSTAKITRSSYHDRMGGQFEAGASDFTAASAQQHPRYKEPCVRLNSKDYFFGVFFEHCTDVYLPGRAMMSDRGETQVFYCRDKCENLLVIPGAGR